MTNEQLAAEIQAGDWSKILLLWDGVKGYAYRQANRWYKAAGGRGGVAVEDLEQSSFVAFLLALDTWKSDEGPFLPWFKYHIKSEFVLATAQRTQRDRLDPLESALSLDMPLLDGEGTPFTLANVVADPRAEQDMENLEEIERQESVRRVVNSLPEDQRRVILLRFFQGLTREQVSQRLRLTKTRANAIEQKALRVLRHPSRSKNLRQFYR